MQMELSSLFGLVVYDDQGKHIGVVNDVRLDSEEKRVTELALINLNPDFMEKLKVQRKGILIPYRWVMAVGDIIIIKQMLRSFKKQDMVYKEKNMK
ncbi:MAG TPA: photosystem reaction center subunit H [Methanosarcinales archaeon]|nr:photosystem reaction center subunit H [Methanosarcinales archaeon]